MAEFDNESFAATARFLARHNPYCTSNAEELAQWMQDEAKRYQTKPGYFATLGFIIVACERRDGPGLYYKAGLDTAVVTEWLN